MIPTTEQCIQLLDEFNVPENIREHSFAVNNVSMLIAKELEKAGIDVDLDLINAASILHDLDKIETLKEIEKHGKLTFKWLFEKGYAEVGEIIKIHTFPGREVSWESKVVSYADKRCSKDNVVSIEERYQHIKKVYPQYYKDIHKELAFKLEKEIFDRLDINPEDIR